MVNGRMVYGTLAACAALVYMGHPSERGVRRNECCCRIHTSYVLSCVAHSYKVDHVVNWRDRCRTAVQDVLEYIRRGNIAGLTRCCLVSCLRQPAFLTVVAASTDYPLPLRFVYRSAPTVYTQG